MFKVSEKLKLKVEAKLSIILRLVTEAVIMYTLLCQKIHSPPGLTRQYQSKHQNIQLLSVKSYLRVG